MTELAYMIREDWAQGATAVGGQNAVIREWLGEPPYIFATSDLKRTQEPSAVDLEFVNYLAASSVMRQIVGISELRKLSSQGKRFEGTLTIVHPIVQDDCELLRELVEGDLVARLFVMVWSPSNMVRSWLDGLGARNLNTEVIYATFDAVQLEAAKCMANEQYNGLSTGDGKSAVVQLVHAFVDGGYALEKEPWLNAFFAAGGEFRHAESISKLISEMEGGVKHRVAQRYLPEILEILRERAIAKEEELIE